MQEFQESKLREQPLSRRKAIRMSAIGLGTLAGNVGCNPPRDLSGLVGPEPEEPLVLEPEDPAVSKPEKENPDVANYRIYGIVARDPGKPLQFGKELPVMPQYCVPHWHAHKFNYAIWATKEEAEAFEAIDAYVVIPHTPSTVVEVVDGDRKQEDSVGKEVAVKLFPAAKDGQYGSRPCESLEQVAMRWRKALKGAKVTITKQQTRTLKPMEFAAEPNQILIEFGGLTRREQVSKLIKSHPQTLMVKWDGAFTYCYCPGCGMG